MQQSQTYFRAGILLMAASFVDADLAERLVEAARVTPMPEKPHTTADKVDDGERVFRRILKFMGRRNRPVTRRDIQAFLGDGATAQAVSELMAVLVQAGRVAELERPINEGAGRPPKSPFYVLS